MGGSASARIASGPAPAGSSSSTELSELPSESPIARARAVVTARAGAPPAIAANRVSASGVAVSTVSTASAVPEAPRTSTGSPRRNSASARSTATNRARANSAAGPDCAMRWARDAGFSGLLIAPG